MGHESIETTKRYEHFAHEMIAVENCNSHLDNIYLKGPVKIYAQNYLQAPAE